MSQQIQRTWVVMPLYMWPLTDLTWKPLYDSIAAYPDLNFLVVVNPNSGPGSGPLPGTDYVREVPKLNSFPNVQTVGYVRIDYCRQPLEQSYHDIDLYAGWHRDHEIPGLYVEGIYIDETPNHVSEESGSYLSALRQFIKDSDGLQGGRLVIQNPGTPPEGDLVLFGNPEVVCVCEEPNERYDTDGVQQRLQKYAIDWAGSIYQISGIPKENVAEAVRDLCKRGKYIFATDLVDNFYESFGPSWNDFVAAVRSSHDVR